MINITKIELEPVAENEKLKARANIIIDDCFIVKGLKVLDTSKGHWVAMPSIKRDDKFHDVVYALNNETRLEIEKKVLDYYFEQTGESASNTS